MEKNLSEYRPKLCKLFGEIDRTASHLSRATVDFAQSLVQVNSANPFTPESSDPNSPIELQMVHRIDKELDSIGVNYEHVGVSTQRPNIVVRLPGTRGGKTLILNGHMDTVMPSDDYSIDPFAGKIDGNKLYGLGALDMKASLAAFVYAIKTILELQIRLRGNLITTFVVDEEPGGCSRFGTQYLLEQGLDGDAAIVGEPGNRNITIGHRGGYRLKLTVFGEAEHTGKAVWEQKKKGRNAIVDMASVITMLQEITIPSSNTATFPGRRSVFTFPTLIQGGTSINVVPDTCIAYGDCRLLPGNTDQQIIELIEGKLSNWTDLEYKLENLLYVPAVEISTSEEIVQMLAWHTHRVTGKRPSMQGCGPWNDGWMFITRGIPAICGYGARGKGVHAANEFVYIDSLLELTKVYARVIVDYLGVEF